MRGYEIYSRFVCIFCRLFYFHFCIRADRNIRDYVRSRRRDAGLEWVEIHNTGTTPVDLTAWRLFEADTNHKLGIVSGDGVLGGGEYGLIVSDVSPVSFGEVFDSTFSLSNTGETIGIRDGDLSDISMVTYSSEWGASGDGNSLQKMNGVWKAARPTPGAANTAVAIEPTSNEEDPTDPRNNQHTKDRHGLVKSHAASPLGTSHERESQSKRGGGYCRYTGRVGWPCNQ
jgi:hypothetical protein